MIWNVQLKDPQSQSIKKLPVTQYTVCDRKYHYNVWVIISQNYFIPYRSTYFLTP